MEEVKLYIHGEYQLANSNQYFENISPATGKVIGRVQVAAAQDVEKAVASCQEGFENWSAMTAAERSRILHKASRILRERNGKLARLEVLDTGKPLSEAIAVDIVSGADCLEYFAGIAAGIHGEHISLGNDFAYTRREPLGVCAGIGAWNYPMQIACWKSAPALACGNAMLFKPAELTPLSALKLAEIYMEAGVPPGVFNVIQGEAEVGKMLTAHPGIAKVSLTGEVGTGKKVMAAAAATLKHVTLELGGKSPIIIYEDAYLDEAVAGAMLGNFYTQGEICSNGTRVFVHRSIRDAFLEKLVQHTQKLRIGNPLDMQTQVGALISAEHYQKVMQYIKIGQNEGATLLTGGKRKMLEGDLAGGYFVEPAVFVACQDEMRIVQEEIFGPVMSVLDFEEEEEAISRANDTPYGLAAGVFTHDLRRAHRTVAQLQAGICWINTFNITPVEIPFGGYKQSGLGRENGLAAIEHYTQLKTVYVAMKNIDSPY